MDEFRGADYTLDILPFDAVPFDAVELPLGRMWPWVILAIGVLIIAAGAVMFTAW